MRFFFSVLAFFCCSGVTFTMCVYSTKHEVNGADGLMTKKKSIPTFSSFQFRVNWKNIFIETQFSGR